MVERPIYTIRLRGPWQLEPLARFVRQPDGKSQTTANDLPPPARQKMPADWSSELGDDFLGRVRYRRTFQSPTGLDEGQRVWLVVEPPRSRGTVELGGVLVGEVRHGGPALRCDITDQLLEHNYLVIDVEHPPLDGAKTASDDGATHVAAGLVGEVRLEIEE